jgi:hypothetical protein
MKRDPKKRKKASAVQLSAPRGFQGVQHQAALACLETALAADRCDKALRELQGRGLAYCVKETDENGNTEEIWFASEYGPLAGKYGPHSAQEEAV